MDNRTYIHTDTCVYKQHIHVYLLHTCIFIFLPAIVDSPDVFSLSDCDQTKLLLSDLICRGRNNTKDPTRYSVGLSGVMSEQLTKLDMDQLRTLEKIAAGCVNEEDRTNTKFSPCIFFMNNKTANTRRPYCVVNGELQPTYVHIFSIHT